MRYIMDNGVVFDPLPEATQEELIIKVLAPKSAKGDSRLYQRSVKIQQSYKPRPLSRPICNRKNRAAMTPHAWEYMMRILPCGRSKYEIGLRVYFGKDIHPHSLADNEAVPAGLIHRERSPKRNAFFGETRRKSFL
jgi:hypothetical protein